MSKDKDKLKAKKRRQFSNTSASLVKNQQRSKCKKVTRPSGDDGISKSKQLTQKMQTNRSIGRPKTRSTKLTNNEEPRICGNGKPMPSLSDLEKMFEDSDEEDKRKKKNNDVPKFLKNGAHWPTFSDLEKMFEESDDDKEKTVNSSDFTIPNSPDGCSTPKKALTISENNLKSPTTIKTIANKMLDFISNLPVPTVLIDDEAPRPAVVPPKKRKKPEFPYIVGCKDRDRVEKKLKTSFCKGDAEYGVDRNNVPDEEDECPKKRAKRGKAANISKSIFNAKSDEIAARLKESDGALNDRSFDSNNTVAYQYYTPPSASRPQSFSPLPSTSRDSEIIQKNDLLFNQSYIAEQPPNEKVNDSVELINNPIETIVIDDEIVNTTPIVINSAVIEIDDSHEPVQYIKDTAPNDLPNNIDDNSCIEIIECSNSANATRADSPILVDDYYSSLDLNQPFINEDATENIDVDEVIAENKALIDKYRHSNDFSTVTSVDLSANNIDSLKLSMTQNIATSIKPNANNIENLPPSGTQNTGTVSECKINNDCELVKTGSTDKYVLRHYAVPVDDETVMEIDYLYRPGQPTSPVLQISNMPKNRSQNGSYNTIEETARSSLIDARNVADNQSGNHQSSSETRCVILRSSNDPKVFAQRKKYRKAPPPNFATSIPVQIQTEPLPTGKGLGDCPICMDSLTRHPVASTICGHIFCLNCIKAAVKASGKKCPTCRKPLKGVGFHQLFL